MPSASALRRSKGGAGGADFVPVVAPEADLSFHDDEERVAGIALLDQHGTVLEVLRLDYLGEPTEIGPRAGAAAASSNSSACSGWTLWMDVDCHIPAQASRSRS